jgi:hypothetical protein
VKLAQSASMLRSRRSRFTASMRMVQPPAFPTTSRPRGGDGDGDLPVPGQKGFCACQGLRRRGGQRVSCNIDTSRVAFCGTENISTPNSSYAAQYLASSPVNASRLPSRTTRASLGASAVRCSFAVTDFYRLPLAGLPAHPSTHDPMRHAEESEARQPPFWAYTDAPNDRSVRNALRMKPLGHSNRWYAVRVGSSGASRKKGHREHNLTHFVSDLQNQSRIIVSTAGP